MKTAQELLDHAASREEQEEQYDNYEMGKLPDNITLVYHSYTYENYTGSAYGFGFDTDLGLWFEVSGSHCSCYGLEGQWDPDYSTFDQLAEAIKRTIDAHVSGESRYRYTEPNNDEVLQEFVGYFGPKA